MKSSGNPSESYRRNISSPGTTLRSDAAARSSTCSRRPRPVVSTASKRSSSDRITLTTLSRLAFSSG